MAKRVFSEIPDQAPVTPLLDQVLLPADLRQFSDAQLLLLADELREYLLYSVGQTGGHFGAGLGVIELTMPCIRCLIPLSIISFGMLVTKVIRTKY